MSLTFSLIFLKILSLVLRIKKLLVKSLVKILITDASNFFASKIMMLVLELYA